MAVVPFRLLPPPLSPSFLSTSSSLSCAESQRLKHAVSKSLPDRLSTTPLRRFPRRMILQFLGFKHIMGYSCPVLAASIRPEMMEPEVLRTLKLDSGVRIQEIIEGEGPEAHSGDLVEFHYACRRANGYYVYSTVDQFNGGSRPVILALDENQMIEGLKEVLTGMRVGGKRRALIPPSAGYVNENLKPAPEEFGPRRSLFSHAKEPLVFEVQLLKIL